MSPPRLVEIVELEPLLRPEAGAVLAAAFLDDPAWVAIGPSDRVKRHRLLARYYDTLVGEALRYGGPSWCAMSDGRVAGVCLVYPDGLRFPPPWADLREAPPFLRAGPGPSLRALRTDQVMKGAHPKHPHLHLWYLAAHPSAQRSGVGSALVARVQDQAAELGVPIYLDTTNPENVPWYKAHGFTNTGDAALQGSARVWFFHQDASGATSAP